MQKIIDKLRPAFDEACVYPCAVLGVVLSPVIMAAAQGEHPKLVVHWWDFATSLVITVAILMMVESQGTAAGKRQPAARFRRYGFAFFAGLAWRQIVPVILAAVTKLFEAIA
jgi:hypothetical protein